MRQVEYTNPFLLRLVSLEHDVVGLMGLNETVVMGSSLLIPSLPASKGSNPVVSTSEIFLSDFIVTALDVTTFLLLTLPMTKPSDNPLFSNMAICVTAPTLSSQ